MPAAHTCSPSKMFYLWRWLKGSGDVRVPRAAGIISITPQWIFSCRSGADSIFTNNLYFHIELLPGPSLELALSSCKQGGWYRQGVKFGVPFPAFLAAANVQRGANFLAVSELCPHHLLVLMPTVYTGCGRASKCVLCELLGDMQQLNTSKHEFVFSSFKG